MKTCLSNTLNIMVADGLGMQRARASAAMVLTKFDHNMFWFQHQKG